MPKSALPEHLKNVANWKGTDWDTWYQRWMLPFKHWFAYGPRATEWWAKWREYPITVFAAFGKGLSRWENTDGSSQVGLSYPKRLWMYTPWTTYLSAIQRWTKWHIQIQWPLYIGFHYYIGEVPVCPDTTSESRVFFFRAGARRDADRVYWFPDVYIGIGWN